MASPSIPASMLQRPWLVRLLIAVALALCAAYAIRAPGHWGGEHMDGIFAQWVYDSVAVAGGILCTWRAIRVRHDRTVWSLIALSFLFQVAGNELYTGLYGSSVAPFPSIADAMWIACYLPLIAALALRIRAAGGARGVVILDILIAFGALSSISAAFVVGAILTGGSSSTFALLTSLAYPVFDLVLATLVLHLAAANGWRLGRATMVLAVCFLYWAVTDSLYAYQTLHETYVGGGLLDLGWVVPFALFGVAAWLRPDPPIARQSPGLRALVVPAGFAVIALLVVVYSALADVTVLSLAFAAAALVGVIARFVFTYRNYLVVLADTEREATTDALTGLGNRRSLTADLEAAIASGADTQLLLFDLNGFKGYNDAFGHPSGDALLQRLGRCLRDAVEPEGTAYRMGGDEFCVLLGADAGQRTVSAAGAALIERGDGFAISASQGRAAIPAEATSAAEALRTADQRMYQSKRAAHGPAGEQATQALMRVLTERHPDVGDHSQGVADLAEALARELGCDDEQAREVRAGADLHDIGKAAIPDAILSKPGPLDDVEWAFMRRHTLIGERIVASAHALTSVAKLVRSSHERWDGAGYPDGLAGDAIPLGARIIFVCDAFDAMLADRPYSKGLGLELALTELEHCAGSQFDPQVVAAFVKVVRGRAASPLDELGATPLSS
jgi:diguanylate cyclase (GGDEF)-like protein/putative nucleotidyltransferase with HDIG domain